jgi:hypothetical protein
MSTAGRRVSSMVLKKMTAPFWRRGPPALFRAADYARMAGKMKRERSEHLASFDGLDPSILKSIAQLHRKRAIGRNGLRHVRANAIPFACYSPVTQDHWIPFL